MLLQLQRWTMLQPRRFSSNYDLGCSLSQIIEVEEHMTGTRACSFQLHSQRAFRCHIVARTLPRHGCVAAEVMFPPVIWHRPPTGEEVYVSPGEHRASGSCKDVCMGVFLKLPCQKGAFRTGSRVQPAFDFLRLATGA